MFATTTIQPRENITAQTRDIAKTIFEQLGGTRFAFMTGAKRMQYGCGPCWCKDKKDELVYFAFSIPKRKGKPNLVIIYYDAGLDLYHVQFVLDSPRWGTSKLYDQHEGLDVEQMREAFERSTGLYLSL